MQTKAFLLRSAFVLAALVPAGTLFASDTIRADVLVDVTDAGGAVAPATPGQPVYYLPFPVGYHDKGGAKPGERTPPAPDQIEHLFAKALAADGYLLCSKQLPPSIVLTFEWGYAAPAIGRATVLGGRTEISDSDSDVMRTIVGGKWLANVQIDDPGAERQILQDAAGVPQYYATVTALDYKAMLQKKRVPLWIARLSTEAAGVSADDALATIIAAGGPRFGKRTMKPLLIVTPIVHPE